MDSLYIVKLLGILRSSSKFGMVMEYCPCGDLSNLLYYTNAPISMEYKKKIAMDIIKGLKVLHSCTPPIVHRDLRSPNIYV